MTPGFSSSPYPQKWSVWIDYNNDFFFDNVKELVFSTTVGDLGTVSGAFQVAPGAPTVVTRMRVVMYYGSSPSACNERFYGETEDYLVNLIPFCASAGQTNYEYIQTVGIGSLLNDSGNDGGYADYTDLFMEATAGAPTGLALVPGFTGSEYKEYWRIWIDFNQDRSFEPAEQVFQSGPSSELVFGSFTIPESTTAGKYGLRVSMRYGGFPNPCGNFGSGEVEDYKLHILEGDGGELNGNVDDRSSGLNLSNNASDNAAEIQLYPNPARTTVAILWNDVQPISGQLVNATGQALMTFGHQDKPASIDVTSFPTGLYTLQIMTAEKVMVTKRFVKVD